MNYFSELQKEGLSGEALVKKGALIRLRPVLMTALVDIFGFLPPRLSTGVGAEVQNDSALVVIWRHCIVDALNIDCVAYTLFAFLRAKSWLIKR